MKHSHSLYRQSLYGILLEELLNSSSRILYFNECLLIFQFFYSGQYIPVWYTPINHEYGDFIKYDSKFILLFNFISLLLQINLPTGK